LYENFEIIQIILLDNPYLNPYPKIRARGYNKKIFVASLPNFREGIQGWVIL